MTQPVEQFIRTVNEALPRATIQVDKPARDDGHWFLDLTLDGHHVTAEWYPADGFGVSSPALDSGYGEGPEEVFSDSDEAATRVVELLETRTRTRPPAAVLLRDLRVLSKLTQEELAERLGISQAAVSKMERRNEMTVSTLRRLVEAMGGELELLARFPGESVRIAQFDSDITDATKAPGAE